MKRLMVWAFAILLLFAAALIVFRIFAQQRVAKQIAIPPQEGIHSLEKLRLGGADQWILIRGWNRTKPLLLFVHGGPGFPEMPFAHVNADLERDFVVVQWDQRGAGKSYPAPNDSLDVEQFVSDTRELSALLLKRFGAQKLFLVGHSWGSLIGALVAARDPDKFFAYVGISQFADALESERTMYRFALQQAERTSNARASHELKQIGSPPYESMRNFRTMKKWVNRFGERDYQPMGRWQFARLAFASPIYSWRDFANLAWGARTSFDELWREVFYKVNLMRDAPRIDVPVYFLEGRHDRLVTTSAAMAERYFDALDAPRGKQLIWFEKSGHWPQLEEPEKFRAVLIEQVLKDTQ
ncbi:MAG: alpha/beta hydrolase [Chthoniobacterales bacterium]|nr:MAG: alpha/beta hydrolase [Chthoniobacterales bacterium]